MTVLKLGPDLVEDLRQVLDLLPQTPIDTKDDFDLRRALHLIPTDLQQVLKHVFDVVWQVLRDNAFVQIRGFPLSSDARSILLLGHALGSVFVDLSHQPTIVSQASPALNATLQGNQTEALFLHTDYAMVDVPPEVTVIQCVEPDPLGSPFGDNGVAVARHIVSRFNGTAKLELVLNTLMPFAGKKPDGSNILTMRPILELVPDGDPFVRFHPSRIFHGIRTRGEPAKPQEIEALTAFQSMTKDVRINLPQAKGDLLIVNNHSALHDRGLCSLSLSKSGLNSRISRILFVQQLQDVAG